MAVVEPDSTGAVAVKGHARGITSWPATWQALTLAGIAETEGARLTIWSPVLLVTGIWSYFLLDTGTRLGIDAGIGGLSPPPWRGGCVPSHPPSPWLLVLSGFCLGQAANGIGSKHPWCSAYTPDVRVAGRVFMMWTGSVPNA
jgi:hypothetical protein